MNRSNNDTHYIMFYILLLLPSLLGYILPSPPFCSKFTKLCSFLHARDHISCTYKRRRRTLMYCLLGLGSNLNSVPTQTGCTGEVSSQAQAGINNWAVLPQFSFGFLSISLTTTSYKTIVNMSRLSIGSFYKHWQYS